MKKQSWLFAFLVSLAGLASAQNAPLEGISESTDPAKVADVSRRAQEIASRPRQNAAGDRASDAGSGSMHGGRRMRGSHGKHRHDKDDAR